VRYARLVSVLTLGLGLAAALSTSASGRTADSLHMHANVDAVWNETPCPKGTSGSHPECYTAHAQGVVRGLGRIAESDAIVVDDYTGAPTLLHIASTITLAGKGEIDVTGVTPSTSCGCDFTGGSFDYTVSGGSGAFAGAQGSGTLDLAYHTNGHGTDAWTGTLTAPGHTFDLAAPVLTGIHSRVVTAPTAATRARVAYVVTARDPDEGKVPATCTPHSGSFFKVGRTTVRCAATDGNGNTASAHFTVTVRRAG
jgi:hypothetical protein